MKKIFLIVTTFVFVTLVVAQPKYEFRAVWVATVANIDWPSKPGLSSEAQMKEVTTLLDHLASMKMNTVILQVRPAADALYKSTLEPWSRYLTGTPGKTPNPYYDPLHFWVEECHKRGMELHAWLNPFRVALNAKEPLAGNHIAFQHPEWILRYGNKLYFDPGLPQTREFVTNVVKDIVLRYDIDAIHFDDYFYPYPLSEDFPDTVSFKTFGRGFLPENKADWRRNNIDILIEKLNRSIKLTKPWVKFGISPFGVWRNIADDPNGSATKAGATNYDHLYADVIKWQRKGWIDYLLPQLYWQIGHPKVDFKILSEWWESHNYNRNVFVGLAPYKVDRNSTVQEWRDPDELPSQIRMLRSLPAIGGMAFYSSKHFSRDLLGLQDSLKTKFFKKQAIVPPMHWIDSIAPLPVFSLKKRGRKLKWETAPFVEKMNQPSLFVVYANEQGQVFDMDNADIIWAIVKDKQVKFPRKKGKKKKYEIRVSVLDRLSNESRVSKPVFMKL
ncbi:MAG: hypothetical protein CSA36_04275 [Draconibacterium sp.]|nr:MAG: hypothetical protein CSA36_04275 [Draconibacterium sp.]